MSHEGMLSGYRVLDITDERGSLCGKALADLGADVIKIERPGGSSTRNIGPFYHDVPDPEKSLYWFAFNAGKRGITLDITTADGQDILKRLVKSADFLIESFTPGYLDKLGLGYAEVSKINSRIIMVSITGFGQEGPYSKYKASDIVVWALSGMMNLIGEPDRPPLIPSYPHSFLFGEMQGAVGAMIALYQRHLTGHGQHVDVSAHMALVAPTQPEVIGNWVLYGDIVKRSGRTRVRPLSGVSMPCLWRCKDGDVSFLMQAGAAVTQANKTLAKWIESEGTATDAFKKINWDTFSWDHVTQELAEEITKSVSGFFLKHTKKELFEGALKEDIQLYPSLTPGEMLQFNQLIERGYWVKVAHPELDTDITYPGAFVRSTETACEIQRRAPLIGEHNEAIYKELGLSSEELLALKKARVI
jgi:benzylsuccinate CoA-transferase BbsE subunit